MRGTVVVSVKLRGEDITRDAVLVPACKGGPEHKPSSEVVTKAGARCKPISLQNARQRLLSADEVGTDVKAIILQPLARAWSGKRKQAGGKPTSGCSHGYRLACQVVAPLSRGD